MLFKLICKNSLSTLGLLKKQKIKVYNKEFFKISAYPLFDIRFFEIKFIPLVLFSLSKFVSFPLFGDMDQNSFITNLKEIIHENEFSVQKLLVLIKICRNSRNRTMTTKN